MSIELPNILIQRKIMQPSPFERFFWIWFSWTWKLETKTLTVFRGQMFGQPVVSTVLWKYYIWKKSISGLKLRHCLFWRVHNKNTKTSFCHLRKGTIPLLIIITFGPLSIKVVIDKLCKFGYECPFNVDFVIFQDDIH